MCDLVTTPSEGVCFTYLGPESDTSASTVGSEVNVALTGIPTGSITYTRINLFEIVLYSEDEGAWQNWKDQANSTTESQHLMHFTGYTMFWYCSLEGTLNSTKLGSGCCLRDREYTEGGGNCIVYNNDSHPQTV